MFLAPPYFPSPASITDEASAIIQHSIKTDIDLFDEINIFLHDSINFNILTDGKSFYQNELSNRNAKMSIVRYLFIPFYQYEFHSAAAHVSVLNRIFLISLLKWYE